MKEIPIEAGDYIKHEKFMDVALHVEYSYDNGDHFLVTGLWMNQGFEKSWYVPFKDLKKRRRNDIYSSGGGYGPDTQTIKIYKTKLNEWLKVKMPPRSQCLRKCEWKSVA